VSACMAACVCVTHTHVERMMLESVQARLHPYIEHVLGLQLRQVLALY